MPNLTPDQPQPVKRFVVFAYDDYYPGGGWDDCCGSFDTFDEAMADAKDAVDRSNEVGHYRYDNAEVVDLTTGACERIRKQPDSPMHVAGSVFWERLSRLPPS